MLIKCAYRQARLIRHLPGAARILFKRFFHANQLTISSPCSPLLLPLPASFSASGFYFDFAFSSLPSLFSVKFVFEFSTNEILKTTSFLIPHSLFFYVSLFPSVSLFVSSSISISLSPPFPRQLLRQSRKLKIVFHCSLRVFTSVHSKSRQEIVVVFLSI